MATGAIIARIITQYSAKGSKQAQKDITKLGKDFDKFAKRSVKAFGVAAAASAVRHDHPRFGYRIDYIIINSQRWSGGGDRRHPRHGRGHRAFRPAFPRRQRGYLREIPGDLADLSPGPRRDSPPTPW